MRLAGNQQFGMRGPQAKWGPFYFAARYLLLLVD
jgi:hypothetical protein